MEEHGKIIIIIIIIIIIAIKYIQTVLSITAMIQQVFGQICEILVWFSHVI